MQGRERQKILIGGGEVKGNSGENWYGGGGGWNRAERAGESVCFDVFGTRNVDYIAGEFGESGDVG